MPVPSGYATETDLATFMAGEIGRIASILGLTVPAGYTETIIDTLIAYGVETIDEAADIRKLRALARREIWRGVVAKLASGINFTADGVTVNRSQLQQQAKVALTNAETACVPFDDQYVVRVDHVTQTVDPYVYRPIDAI